MIVFALQGVNQTRKLQFWAFVGYDKVICFGPQDGGWSAHWKRKDLLELYGLPERTSMRDFIGFMRRVWGVSVRRVEAPPNK